MKALKKAMEAVEGGIGLPPPLESDDEDEEPFQRSKPETICTESDDDDDPDEVIIEKELSVDEIVRKRIRDAEEKGDEIVLY